MPFEPIEVRLDFEQFCFNYEVKTNVPGNNYIHKIPCEVTESLAVLDIDGEGLIPVGQLRFLMCQTQPGLILNRVTQKGRDIDDNIIEFFKYQVLKVEVDLMP